MGSNLYRETRTEYRRSRRDVIFLLWSALVLTKTYQVPKAAEPCQQQLQLVVCKVFLCWAGCTIAFSSGTTVHMKVGSNVTGIITLTTQEQESWISSDAGVRELVPFTKQCQDNNDCSPTSLAPISSQMLVTFPNLQY